MLKSNGALSTEEREEEMKQMEVYRSHSKFMKNKVTTRRLGTKRTVMRNLNISGAPALFLTPPRRYFVLAVFHLLTVCSNAAVLRSDLQP